MGRLVVYIFLTYCAGCATVIIPPAHVEQRAMIRVADYGYHSSLIMPTRDGGVIEYTFGDWIYFAQNDKSFKTLCGALLSSEQSTLGRRVFGPGPDLVNLEQRLGAKSLIAFDVERDTVWELERELETRYSKRLGSITFSTIHNLYFVKDDQPYGMMKNCNHMTAKWLEKLGCKVEGWVMLSKFKLKGIDS